jgi:hypothetical protein
LRSGTQGGQVPRYSVRDLEKNEAKYNKQGGKEAKGKGLLAPSHGDKVVRRGDELEPVFINTRRELLGHFHEHLQERKVATSAPKKDTKGTKDIKDTKKIKNDTAEKEVLPKAPPKGYKPKAPKVKMMKFPTLAEIKKLYNDPKASFIATTKIAKASSKSA